MSDYPRDQQDANELDSYHRALADLARVTAERDALAARLANLETLVPRIRAAEFGGFDAFDHKVCPACWGPQMHRDKCWMRDLLALLGPTPADAAKET